MLLQVAVAHESCITTSYEIIDQLGHIPRFVYFGGGKAVKGVKGEQWQS